MSDCTCRCMLRRTSSFLLVLSGAMEPSLVHSAWRQQTHTHTHTHTHTSTSLHTRAGLRARHLQLFGQLLNVVNAHLHIIQRDLREKATPTTYEPVSTHSRGPHPQSERPVRRRCPCGQLLWRTAVSPAASLSGPGWGGGGGGEGYRHFTTQCGLTHPVAVEEACSLWCS